jgi:retinol dehydrogenase 13
MPLRLPEELQYIQNSLLPQKTTSVRLDGKKCVITGATSGIGLAVSKLFAKNGAELLLICRNESKAQSLQQELHEKYGAKSHIFIADFDQLEEVRKIGHAISEQHPKINILINNAGIFNKRRKLTKDGNEQVFQVVHLAAFLLSHILLDALSTGAPSRVIMVNSEAHRFGGLKMNDLNWEKRPFIGLQAYGASKIAQILTSLKMAELWDKKRVTVNLIHPGAVRTNIGMNNHLLYRFYSKYILSLFLKDVSVAANAIYYLAAAPELVNKTGAYFNLTNEEKPASYVIDPVRTSKIWEISKKLAQVGE